MAFHLRTCSASVWLLVSVYARAPCSLHCAIASSFQGQGGRQECRISVAHRTCSLGCSRVFNRIFLFTKVSKGSNTIMPLSHSAVFAAREPATGRGGAAMRGARRQAGAPRSQRGRSRRRRRGRPGRPEQGPV